MTAIMHRFRILFGLMALGLNMGGYFSAEAWAGGPDGFLRLYHSHNKDFLEIRYLDEKGAYDAAAFKKLNYFMRSRDNGEEIAFNPLVISLLDRIQDHFGVDTVEVISGYRRPAFNDYLRETGHHVAKESYHKRGWAADIHVDEITEEALSRFVRRLHVGGVGLYSNNLMVHVDVGRVNFWQEGPIKNRLDIGEVNEKIAARLTTDRLFYKAGQTQRLTFASFDRRRFDPVMTLEWFRRGNWKKWGGVPLPAEVSHDLVQDLSAFPFGKFRWKVSARDGRVQYSNEFYLKKK